MKWFSVKTLYKVSVTGSRNSSTSEEFKTAFLLEERVVIFKARNFNHAIKRAQNEAENYARMSHTNPYGQCVTCKFLNTADAFELCDSLDDGAEIYSMTELHVNRMSKKELLDRKFGRVFSARKEEKLRKKFLDIEFSAQ